MACAPPALPTRAAMAAWSSMACQDWAHRGASEDGTRAPRTACACQPQTPSGELGTAPNAHRPSGLAPSSTGLPGWGPRPLARSRSAPRAPPSPSSRWPPIARQPVTHAPAPNDRYSSRVASRVASRGRARLWEPPIPDFHVKALRSGQLSCGCDAAGEGAGRHRQRYTATRPPLEEQK